MSLKAKTLVAIGLLTVVTACAQQQAPAPEPMPAPVTNDAPMSKY